jgi:hypothetical protein
MSSGSGEPEIVHLFVADMREEGQLLPLFAIAPVKQGSARMLFHAGS